MSEYNWMSPDQRDCYKLLCDLYFGEHHVVWTVKPCGKGIEVNVWGELATYDFDCLTRAVIMAHDRAIRFAVRASGPGKVKLQIHKRQREGDMFERHPTIEEAIARFRK